MEDYRKYLQPVTIAQLKSIEMKARLVVEGFITGLHRSPYHGFSVEFAEHRQYRPGDSIKHLDWKILGRTEKHYVKQYEEETNLRSMIALDTSGSMNYASKGNITKFEYASYLAAALSYLLIKQRDAVGLTLYDTDIRTFIPPRSKQSYLHQLLKTLVEVKPANETGTSQSLDKLAERINRRGLVVIISDFFDDPESITNALKHFRHKQHDVLVFQILDPREKDFKFKMSGANFLDMETGEELVTQPYQIQQSYAETMKEFLNTIRRESRNHFIDYHLITTDTPFDKALRAYLTKRAKLA